MTDAGVPETAITYALQGDTVYVVSARKEGGLTAVPRVVRVGETRDGRLMLAGLRHAADPDATAPLFSIAADPRFGVPSTILAAAGVALLRQMCVVRVAAPSAAARQAQSSTCSGV